MQPPAPVSKRHSPTSFRGSRVGSLALAAVLWGGMAAGWPAQAPLAVAPAAAPAAAAVPAAEGTDSAPVGFLESPRLFRASQWLLAGAAGFDYFQTIRGMSRPPILHLTVSSPWETHTVDLDFRSSIAEGGWAKVVGAHNIGGVVAANAGLDLLIILAARRLARRGPRWRLMATMALLAQSWVHIEAGRSWLGQTDRLAAPYSQFQPVWIH